MYAFMDDLTTSKLYIAMYVLYYIIHKLSLEFMYRGGGGGETVFFF